MAVELQNKPLQAVAMLILAILCANGWMKMASAAYHRDCNNASSRKSCAASEWGLESEYVKRLLSTPAYIDYGALDEDRAAGQASKPGNSYSRGCQRDHYCRDG